MTRTVFPTLTSGGPLVVGDTATIGGVLTASSTTHLVGAVTADAAVTVAGTLTASGALNVTGALTVGGATKQRANVITAGKTLLASESGSLCLFSTVTGDLYTLPAPVAGLYYDFAVTASVTSGGYKVITNVGTVFINGMLVNVDTDTSNAVAIWTGNNSTIISINMLAAATNAAGGLLGTDFRLTCISATQWMCSGFLASAGTVSTPFATS